MSAVLTLAPLSLSLCLTQVLYVGAMVCRFVRHSLFYDERRSWTICCNKNQSISSVDLIDEHVPVTLEQIWRVLKSLQRGTHSIAT